MPGSLWFSWYFYTLAVTEAFKNNDLLSHKHNTSDYAQAQLRVSECSGISWFFQCLKQRQWLFPGKCRLYIKENFLQYFASNSSLISREEIKNPVNCNKALPFWQWKLSFHPNVTFIVSKLVLGYISNIYSSHIMCLKKIADLANSCTCAELCYVR